MELDFKQLILPQRIGSLLLVSSQLVLKSLNFHRQVIYHAAIFVGAAALGACEMRSIEMGRLERLLFVRRIGFLLEEGRINCNK
jgi:hypothetical protein